MIPFNVPPYTGNEEKYVGQAIKNRKISGDGVFTKKCSAWLEERLSSKKILLTTSGTSALEMAAILCDIKSGDEVIMPSYTFCSTANAFVQRGAKIVFVDIKTDTMNIDENKIEQAITNKTKAIVPVHYAGVSCEMDQIMLIAKKYNLKVIEDAAQGILSTYKGKMLGTIGDFGCFSFHETKNYSMGEGGAISINDSDYIESAEIIREKGTNRSKFIRGQVDKYTWIEYGSSFLPSELNAAYLWGQLNEADKINNYRLNLWQNYYSKLNLAAKEFNFKLPVIPSDCEHNAHMFYLKLRDINERSSFISFLKEKKINSVFHYIPLHSSPAGDKFGVFNGSDVFTTTESEKLVRLPLWYGLPDNDLSFIVNTIIEFFQNK